MVDWWDAPNLLRETLGVRLRYEPQVSSSACREADAGSTAETSLTPPIYLLSLKSFVLPQTPLAHLSLTYSISLLTPVRFSGRFISSWHMTRCTVRC